MTYYIIDSFDPKTKRYRECFRTHDRLWADTMMSKPYHARHTRRLVEVTRTVLTKETGCPDLLRKRRKTSKTK